VILGICPKPKTETPNRPHPLQAPLNHGKQRENRFHFRVAHKRGAAQLEVVQRDKESENDGQ